MSEPTVINDAWHTLTQLILALQAASKDGYSSRELSLAITKLQEGRYWLTDAPTTKQESK